jgi:hypothetical protein
MFLLLAEALQLNKVSQLNPDNDFLKFLAFNQEHVNWRGCSLHDLIQPSFSFLVGVALPFSIASRRARGQAGWLTTLHAFWRAGMLIFLGIFLRSVGEKQTNFTFVDTLTQIGLGYIFLYALGHVSVKRQWLALFLILIGYWAAFAIAPLPEPDFAYQSVNGLSEADRPTGFAAHWDKNTNPAWSFDVWLRDFELHSHTRHDDTRFDCRRPVARSKDSLVENRTIRCDWRFSFGNGMGTGCNWYLPECEADLDAGLGAVQRRMVLPVIGFILRAARHRSSRRLGLSTQGDRSEFDCGLRDGSPDQKVHRSVVQNALRSRRLFVLAAI